MNLKQHSTKSPNPDHPQRNTHEILKQDDHKVIHCISNTQPQTSWKNADRRKTVIFAVNLE